MQNLVSQRVQNVNGKTEDVKPDIPRKDGNWKITGSQIRKNFACTLPSPDENSCF